MKKKTRNRLLTGGGIFFVIALLFIIVVFGGVINVGVKSGHPKAVEWVLQTTMENSVENHAEDILVPDTLKANKDAQLIYRVKNQEGKPVEDIEPFLGAPGHLVIISKNTKAFLHVHPEISSQQGHHDNHNNRHDGQIEKNASFGPELNFHTKFPSEGTYKVWLEIKRGHNQHRKSFRVDVI